MPARPSLVRILASALLLSGSLLPAQAPTQPAAQQPEKVPPPGLYTLNVYANLTQVPTLIISPDGKPIPPLAKDKFFISLDGGPPFHPTQLRVENDDALSLAIVIDDSGNQSAFISTIAESLSKLAPKDLHPNDRVSIYAVDCNIVQSANNLPAARETILSGVKTALSNPNLHGDKHKPACGTSLHLWDAVAAATTKLGNVPSRRVVLLISLGNEHGSTLTFEQLVHIAQGEAAAIFPLRDIEEYAFQRQSPGLRRGGGLKSFPTAIADTTVDPLSKLAQVTGGMAFDVRYAQIDGMLERFIAMLRSRYIVEFPRPDNGTNGSHLIKITVPSHWTFVVRHTGTSIFLPDPSLRNDPNTVPSAPSPATFGNQRPQKQ